jgi:hypothetical protein
LNGKEEYTTDPLLVIIYICMLTLCCCCIFFPPRRVATEILSPSDPIVENKLDKIKKITARNQSKKSFIESSCIICLEDFNMTMPASSENKIVNEKAPLLGPDSHQAIEIPQNNKNLENLANDNEILHPSIAKLDCSHCFHTECIKNWMETKHNKCPICRTLIDLDESEPSNKNSWQRGVVEIQNELHPTLNDYVIVWDNLFEWHRRVTYSYSYEFRALENTMSGINIVGSVASAWNGGGGSSSRW